jgi:hypothetical protein
MNKERTMPEEYRFPIDVWTPATLPMGRLAEYLTELSRLLGETANVHFKEVAPGSAVIVAEIEAPAAPKVRDRLEKVQVGDGPADALKAMKALDTLLASDNAVGALIGPDNVVYVRFAGRNRPKPVRYGPFRERGSLDGVIVRVGGKDRTIPVWLQDGAVTHNCTTSIETSKRLAAHYRDGVLRVHGVGKWSRDPDGSWALEEFMIEDFEVLDETPLDEVVRKIQAAKGGGWQDVDDPLKFLSDLRGEGEMH